MLPVSCINPCQSLDFWFPLIPSKWKSSHLSMILDKLECKLAGWRGRLLSYAGRLILIKHVLSSIPLFLCSALPLPQSFFIPILQVFARFFLGQTEFGNRVHWVAWSSICRPTEEGGLGIRDLRETNVSFMCKHLWKLSVSTSLWSTLISAKYLQGSSIQNAECKRGHSAAWRAMSMSRNLFLQNTVWKDDHLVWTADSSGKFSVKSAWEVL